MINGIVKKRIGTLFKSYGEDVVIKEVFNWDAKHWIVIATHAGVEDEIDPYYKVSKLTGIIEPFHPGEDFEKFSELMAGT